MKQMLSVTLLLFSLCVVRVSPLHAQGAEEIKIGAIVSLTGFAAAEGKSVREGIELGTDKLRAEGVPIRVIFEDDQTDPKSTISAFKKLEAQKVDAVIGATWAFTTNAAIPAAASAQIPLISTSNLPESLDLDQGRGYAFNIAWSIDTEIAPFKKYLDRDKPKTAVILYDLSSWGQLQRKYYHQALAERNIEIFREYETPAKGVNSWSSVMLQLKEKAPDVIVLLLDPSDIQMVVKSSRELKLPSVFYSSINTFQAFKESQTKTLLEGVCFTYPLEQLHANKEFVSSFTKKFGSDPEVCTDSSYDAIQLVAQAIAKARHDHKPLVDLLRATSYQGILGKYQYSTSASIASGKGSLVCIRQGELQVE